MGDVKQQLFEACADGRLATLEKLLENYKSTVSISSTNAVCHRQYNAFRLCSKCQTPTTRTPATDMLFITPPTNKLTTILQLVVQQICHIAMPESNISTCQDVCDVANFCPLVVNLLYNKL